MRLQPMLQSLGIRARVLILAVLPVVSVVALLGYSLATSRLDDAQQNLGERGDLIARNLALASEFALFSQNVRLLDETLQRIATEPDVKWSAVLDVQRQAIISHGKEPDPRLVRVLVDGVKQGRPLPSGYHFAPIHVEAPDMTDFGGEYESLQGATEGAPDQLLGFAIIQLAPDKILAHRSAIMQDSMLVTLSGLALSILLALLIGNGITEPVLRLIAAVRELQSGNLKARVRVRAGGEIGSLEHGVNRMAESLEQSQQTLQRQVEEATSALRHTVAELKTRNRELDEAREIALRAGQERTEFLARMSHEIRTPLNAVVGFTKLLQSEAMDPKNGEHVRTIRSAAEQLLRVINDILQFIRLDAGAEELESLTFNIGDVLEDVVAMLGPMANEKGLELILLLHADLPETMQGDPGRLAQIVINLVNNAIKFTPQGQVMVEASWLNTDSEEGDIEIAVKDTGVGLDPEEQGRVFTAFTQSDSSITRRFGGTGLGLSIARRLAELMGGGVGVESRKGEGSRFWVCLPCNNCSGPEAVETSGTLAGRRVLVYDTNPFVRRSLRSTLTLWGMQVFNTGRWEQLEMPLSGDSGKERFDTIIVGLNREEREATVVQRMVEQIRRHHDGLILLLGADEDWAPPAAVQAAKPLAWSAKPIRRAALRRLLITSAARSPDLHTAQRQVPETVPCRLSGMQVLVAEDNELNRQLLRHLLAREGVILDEVVSGKAAVSSAISGGYDAILMDLHMPELDGTEAARRIRAELGDQAPPILALTADVFGRSDQACTENVFDDWLMKPVDPGVLVDILYRLYGRRAEQASPEAAPLFPEEMRSRCRAEVRRLVASLRAAARDTDRERARGLLHELKGLAGILGDPRVVEVTRSLKPGIVDDEHRLRDLLDELLHHVERASPGG